MRHPIYDTVNSASGSIRHIQILWTVVQITWSRMISGNTIKYLVKIIKLISILHVEKYEVVKNSNSTLGFRQCRDISSRLAVWLCTILTIAVLLSLFIVFLTALSWSNETFQLIFVSLNLILCQCLFCYKILFILRGNEMIRFFNTYAKFACILPPHLREAVSTTDSHYFLEIIIKLIYSGGICATAFGLPYFLSLFVRNGPICESASYVINCIFIALGFQPPSMICIYGLKCIWSVLSSFACWNSGYCCYLVIFAFTFLNSTKVWMECIG